MGRFLLTHTAAGDCFLLQAQNGRTVISSKPYANMDACKKGMRSILRFAPQAPVTGVPASGNPKFFLTEENGFLLYAANGKVLLTGGPYATKKACLRAIAILRRECETPSLYLTAPGGLRQLKLFAETTRKKKEVPASKEFFASLPEENREEPDFPDIPEAEYGTEESGAAVAPSPLPAFESRAEELEKKQPDRQNQAPQSAATPRLVRLHPTEGKSQVRVESSKDNRPFLSRFFKK